VKAHGYRRKEVATIVSVTLSEGFLQSVQVTLVPIQHELEVFFSSSGLGMTVYVAMYPSLIKLSNFSRMGFCQAGCLSVFIQQCQSSENIFSTAFKTPLNKLGNHDMKKNSSNS